MIRNVAIGIALGLLAMPVGAAQVCPIKAPLTNVATVSVVEGRVQVNQGEQYLPLKLGQTLNQGDRIMAFKGGSTTLRFADGCDLHVDPETLIVVPEESTCACPIGVVPQSIAPGSGRAIGAIASGGIGGAVPQIITVIVGSLIMYENDDDTVSP